MQQWLFPAPTRLDFKIGIYNEVLITSTSRILRSIVGVYTFDI